MNNILFFAILFIHLSFLSSTGQACVSLPKSFQLSGASFNDFMDFRVMNSAAGNRILFAPTNGGRLRDDGANTISVYRDPKSSEICFSIGQSEAKCSINGVEGDDAILDKGSKVRGLINYQANNFLIFSTDANGRKDASLPYLKVEFVDKDRMTIHSYDRNRQVGVFTVTRQQMAMRALGPVGQGSFDLRSNDLSLAPGGCGGSLEQKPFSPTGAPPASGHSS